MKMKQLLFGAAYYDEYLPYDRMEKDMEMMKKAGMNVIRIAESTWSTWEPQEGVFDFTHLHRMLFRSSWALPPMPFPHGLRANVRISSPKPTQGPDVMATGRTWTLPIPST